MIQLSELRHPADTDKVAYLLTIGETAFNVRIFERDTVRDCRVQLPLVDDRPGHSRVVSIVWGPCTYSDNYDVAFEIDEEGRLSGVDPFKPLYAVEAWFPGEDDPSRHSSDMLLAKINEYNKRATRWRLWRRLKGQS